MFIGHSSSRMLTTCIEAGRGRYRFESVDHGSNRLGGENSELIMRLQIALYSYSSSWDGNVSVLQLHTALEVAAS